MGPQAHTPHADTVAQPPGGLEIDTTTQFANSTENVLAAIDKETAAPFPTCSSLHSPVDDVPGAAVPALTKPSSARPTTPTSMDASPKTDEPAPTTSLSATPESISMAEASNPAQASERAPSPISINNWSSRMKVNKDARYKSAGIFRNTRQMMHRKTKNMIVHASRGFQRASYVPTKTTSPRLRSRRYSIDVLTKYWESESGWQEEENMKVCYTDFLDEALVVQVSSCAYHGTATCYSHSIQDADRQQAHIAVPNHEEHEPIPQSEPPLTLPNPLRYQHFNEVPANNPPHDEGIYLEHGDSVIRNKEFNDMLDYAGYEAWMRDGSLSTALELLGLSTDCGNHGIAIVNSNMSQVFLTGAQFGDTHETGYDLYRERLKDKRWIFVPINDGMGGGYGGGSHWSLVIMDRIHKCGFYYDSTGVNSNKMIEVLGCDASRGLLLILREDLQNWYWLPQEHSPSQWWDNLFKNDRGPCGPFVWKMTSLMIDKIIASQSVGDEVNCDLSLSYNYPRWFKSQFNSLYVRMEMQALIVHYKVEEDAARLVEEHDQAAIEQAAIEGEKVVLSNEMPAVFGPPPKVDREGSIETVIEDDLDQDGGVALDHGEQTLINLVGDDDDSDPATRLSDPVDNILLEGEDGMIGLCYGNDSPEPTHREILAAKSVQAQANTREQDEDNDDVNTCQRTRKRHNSVRNSRSNHATY
jgi:hypothetical protein